MMNKLNNLLLLISPIAFISCFRAEENNNEESNKPNFIIIYADDLQYNGVGYNNDVVQTPNIDKIAARSLKFTNAHVAFSLSSPSRAALLTGRYGSQNGVLDFENENRLNDGEVILPILLKQKGYVIGHSGKWHLSPNPEDLGFDFASYFHGNGAYYGRTIYEKDTMLMPEMHVDHYGVKRSIDFISQSLRDDKPFFLFHCPQTPHMNDQLIWDAQDSTKSKYKVEDMPVPENYLDDYSDKPAYLKTVRNKTKAIEYGYSDPNVIKEHTRDYYAVITELDEFLGELFSFLEEKNLFENTVIIFMSDNGWMLGDHGFTSKVLPYMASTHVPLFINGPGISETTNHSLVSNIDVMATVLDILKIDIPEQVNGLSLLPIIKGEKEKVRGELVYEGIGSYGGSAPVLGLWKDSLRYIQTYRSKELDSVVFHELYDIGPDPWEMHNKYGAPEYKGFIADFENAFNKFKQEMYD